MDGVALLIAHRFIIIIVILFLLLVLSKGDNPSRADIVLFSLVIPRIKNTDSR